MPSEPMPPASIEVFRSDNKKHSKNLPGMNKLKCSLCPSSERLYLRFR